MDLAKKGDWNDEFNGKEMVINLAAQISSPNPDLLYRNTVLTTRNMESLTIFLTDHQGAL